MRLNVLNRINTLNSFGAKKAGQDWSSYWTNQTDNILFFGETSKISGGQLKNQMSGASDYLTVTGAAGSYVFACPDNATYRTADTDYIWFDQLSVLRSVTEAELIGYDFTRTLIQYDSDSPYLIRTIIILKPGISVTDEMRDTFLLSYWWDGTLNGHGVIKGNRTLGKSYWYLTLLKDGNSKFWYEPLATGGRVHNAGVESIYWDMMYGSAQRGAELNSGNTVVYSVYEITATQANYFYTGCQVGDVFPCGTAKALSASNKVKLVLGNPLTMPTVGKRPVDQVFAGGASLQSMKTAPFTWNQPEMIYAVIKQITWVPGILWDGNTVQSGYLYDLTSTPRVGILAGDSPIYNDNLTLDTWRLVKAYYNGVNSFLKIGNVTDAQALNIGSNNMGGFTLGSRGDVFTSFSNIQIKEIIGRAGTDSAEVENAFSVYLNNKYGL